MFCGPRKKRAPGRGMSDSDTCTRCNERYPSPYYFVQGAASLLCLRCMKALAPQEQVEVLAQAAAVAGETVRRCLRCDAPMMRGDLIYRDLGSGETTQVREVRWGLPGAGCASWASCPSG